MNTPRPVLLDAARIRALRLERGLSVRALESVLGVGGGWWHSLETGANHDHISLRELTALARELGAHPSELLTSRPTEPELDRDDPKALSDDARRVGRILVDLPLQTTLTRLGTELGWTEQRVEAALDVLEARLPAVGQRLVRGVNGVQIVRDSTSPDPAVAGLASARISDNGLNPTQALILLRVMRGELDEKNTTSATMSNTHRVALAELVNAGTVQAPTSGRKGKYAVKGEVERSLLIDM